MASGLGGGFVVSEAYLTRNLEVQAESMLPLTLHRYWVKELKLSYCNKKT